MMRATLVSAALLAALNGCSMHQLAIDEMGSALAGPGVAFASDDDPDLIRAAAPFSLKLVESLLEQSPRHPGLLLAATRGFTQYAYAFVQADAEELEERDLAAARRLEDRARRLYRRARDYGLRGLGGRPLDALEARDAGLAYWTAASWGALISLSKDEPEVLAERSAMDALVRRALELDEAYEQGAIHTFLIAYEMAQPGNPRDAAKRARAHFARAVELSRGAAAAPYVTLAEAVCVAEERRTEFTALLEKALTLDTTRSNELRLANLIAQRRARWLLSRAERLFIE
jgi:predicted anti-sigma-YlaC factor YlaD